MIGLRSRLRRAPAPIPTQRLYLEPITVALLEAEEAGLDVLGRKLRAAITEEWPPEHWEPHVRTHIVAQFKAQPETIGWHRYMVLSGASSMILAGPRLLIGCLGAFPCAAGDVEIGYSVLPSFQRQGYGTEAARAFVDWLLERPEIHSVSAQTFETMPESVKVMQRCGMLCVGRGDEAGTVRYRRWRRTDEGAARRM